MDTHPSSIQGGSEESKVLYIDDLTPDTHIEDTDSFSALRKRFYNTEPTEQEIYRTLKSAAVFTKFYDYIVQNIAQHQIIIKKELVDVFMSKIRDLRARYEHDEIGRNREDVFELVFAKNGYTRDNKEVEVAELDFRHAYAAMKKIFYGRKRRNPDENKKEVEEFAHLKGTMKILLKEILPTVPLEQLSVADRMESLIIALLHDVVELDPLYANNIEHDFNPDIAKGVKLLSKKAWDEPPYMTLEEKKEYQQADEDIQKSMMQTAKKNRNHDYFKDLPTLALKHLLPKLADRIHNLRTLKGSPQEEIEFKLQETEDYFLIPEIARLSPRGYALIQVEYDKLTKHLDELKEEMKGKDYQ